MATQPPEYEKLSKQLVRLDEKQQKRLLKKKWFAGDEVSSFWGALHGKADCS